MAARKIEQEYVQTGWSFDTEEGLHMEATKGSVDGKYRIVASVKGAHGEAGFWLSKTPESWDRFVECIDDIRTGIADFHEQRAMLAELEAKMILRQEKLSKLEQSKEFLSNEQYQAALANLNKQYPEVKLPKAVPVQVTK